MGDKIRDTAGCVSSFPPRGCVGTEANRRPKEKHKTILEMCDECPVADMESLTKHNGDTATSLPP